MPVISQPLAQQRRLGDQRRRIALRAGLSRCANILRICAWAMRRRPSSPWRSLIISTRRLSAFDADGPAERDNHQQAACAPPSRTMIKGIRTFVRPSFRSGRAAQPPAPLVRSRRLGLGLASIDLQIVDQRLRAADCRRIRADAFLASHGSDHVRQRVERRRHLAGRRPRPSACQAWPTAPRACRRAGRRCRPAARSTARNPCG